MQTIEIQISDLTPEKALKVEQSSRRMFVARLENMQQNGDAWLTIGAVLALLSDCDMLAQMELSNAAQT